MNIKKDPIRLLASPRAVIAQFLSLPGNNRIKNLVNRVEEMDEVTVDHLWKKVFHDFNNRHRDFENILLSHFDIIHRGYGKSLEHFSSNRRLLTGSFFTKEYSIQSAALFNPSIVRHPDQTNTKDGEQRFVVSLRATGEGHISSITFRTGVVDAIGNIKLDPLTGWFTPLKRKNDTVYKKDFLIERADKANNATRKILLEILPDSFTASDLFGILKSHTHISTELISAVEKIIDSNYELNDSSAIPISEKVIFPSSNAESMGMEDVRFVKFKYEENHIYYGTYTAYNGREIRTQLIETMDFQSFKIRTLYGPAVSDKGMALFPEKIDNKYVMVSRQGGEVMNIMYSEDLYHWQEYQPLMQPRYNWELLQIGNCGSPVKTEKGWLLLTHGVGPMRTYVISAILLDLKDPSKIIGRIKEPLFEAGEHDREGYVPNVMYTCGCLLHNDMLLVPFAISDSATGFATIRLDELLGEMLNES